MGKKLAYERYHWFHGQIKARRYPNARKLFQRFEVFFRSRSQNVILQDQNFSFGGDGFLFPPDFMFELTSGEYDGLRRQIGTLKRGEHSKYLPMAFTEQGVAMLSSVLKSKHAIEVNVLNMRAFVQLRQMISSHRDLLGKVEEMEKRYDRQFQIVFEAIRRLMAEPEILIKRIGFQAKERLSPYVAS